MFAIAKNAVNPLSRLERPGFKGGSEFPRCMLELHHSIFAMLLKGIESPL
jgi:hypothetical protein